MPFTTTGPFIVPSQDMTTCTVQPLVYSAGVLTEVGSPVDLIADETLLAVRLEELRELAPFRAITQPNLNEQMTGYGWAGEIVCLQQSHAQQVLVYCTQNGSHLRLIMVTAHDAWDVVFTQAGIGHPIEGFEAQTDTMRLRPVALTERPQMIHTEV